MLVICFIIVNIVVSHSDEKNAALASIIIPGIRHLTTCIALLLYRWSTPSMLDTILPKQSYRASAVPYEYRCCHVNDSLFNFIKLRKFKS